VAVLGRGLRLELFFGDVLAAGGAVAGDDRDCEADFAACASEYAAADAHRRTASTSADGTAAADRAAASSWHSVAARSRALPSPLS
jgi:hypothetical protein